MGSVAWLALGLASGASLRVAHEAAERAGGAARLLALPMASQIAAGLPARAAAGLAAAAERARCEVRTAERHGGRLVAWSDAAYPERLRTIPDPPLALFVAGDSAVLDAPAVAVVGARRASPNGRRLAEEIGRDLAAAGVTVVSGLATGVDAAAHQGALGAPGATVAVMATGLDDVYPRWHRGLAARIRESGALVTELPTSSPPYPANFPRRNRIVSGLAVGVVVVEAAARSGSLVTARLGLDQNRLVFAVPGPVGAALNEGSNALLRDGAHLARSAEDVVEDLLPQLLPDLRRARASRALLEVTPEEQKVLDALRYQLEQMEDLGKHTGFDVAHLAGILLALELRGVVVQSAGKRFRLRAA